MKVYSWFERWREDDRKPEEIEKDNAELLEKEQRVQALGVRGVNHTEVSDMMWDYSRFRMEKELFDLGERLIAAFPDEEDAWWVADSVYAFYARFCHIEKRYEAALKWYHATMAGFDSPDSWENIAACYAEMGDHDNAEIYIRKHIQHYLDLKDHPSLKRWNWTDFARYYVSIDRPDKALALLQPLMEESYGWEVQLTAARAYVAIGEHERGLDLYRAYLSRYGNDVVACAEFAYATYQHADNVEEALRYYEQCIQRTKDYPPGWSPWRAGIYECMCIIHINEGDWKAAVGTLRQYYVTKYPGEQSGVIVEMFENLPPVPDDDSGVAIYFGLRDFEYSPLFPLNRQAGEQQSESAAEEVRHTSKHGFSLDEDELSLN